MRNSFFFVLALCSMSFFSCQEKLPKGIIPESEMENVLYDFHLVQSMELPYSGKAEDVEEVMKALYAKYHITEAEFDTSLSYYSKNLDKLNAMYEHISSRYDAEISKAGVQLNSEKSLRQNPTGDTLDIWNYSKIHLLTASKLNQRYLFTIQADTSYYQHDLFHLILDPHFLFPPVDVLKNSGVPLQNGLVVGLTIQYANDSVSSVSRALYSPQHVVLMAKADSAYAIKAIHGFMALPAKNAVPVVIDGIRLLRIHAAGNLSQESAGAKSVGKEIEREIEDSVPSDLRHSPQELRNRKYDRKINIRKR